MRTEPIGFTDDLTLPADMLTSVLRDADRLAATTRALLEPVVDQRDHLRNVLLDRGQIIRLSEHVPSLTLGAVDGGSVIDQLYGADRLLACALVAEGLRTRRTGELHHASWTDVLPHQHDLDRLNSAVMTCLELSLVGGIGYDLRIFDGSHLTPIIALNSAFSSPNPRVRAQAAHIVEETGTIEALRLMCDNADGRSIVGLPKNDTSTDFREKFVRAYGFDLPPVTDRVLASEVLDHGEMLVPRTPENWHRLHIRHRVNTDDDEERETDPTIQQRVERVAAALDSAIDPLRHSRDAGRGIRITYLKPFDADTCVKLEFKASNAPGHGKSLAEVLSGEVVGPHMQEPYAQFVADLWAKNISVAAEALAAATRHRISDDPRWLPYLTLGYRTRAAGGRG